ncbi:MAG: RagB/SusD family nutrient uptake outer membrane protein, partial [Flavobacteriaceae bacterium]
MRIRNLFIGSFLFLGLFLSCEDYTEGVNTDPNNFTDTSEELLIKQAELQLVESLTGTPPLYAAVFSDQYTGSEFEWETFDNYEVNSREFNGIWADFFAFGYSQAELARDKARASGNQVLEGIAEIHMATFMGEAALLFGDVPFEQVNKIGVYPYPEYDPQTQVLAGVQELLEDGIAKVGDAAVNTFYGGEIFIANNALWAEIGYSLKARYYLAAKQYENAYIAAVQGISSPSGDLLSRHFNTGGARNLFFSFNIGRPNYITAVECHLRKLMTGEVDRALSTPGDFNRTFYYFDQDNNLNTDPGGYFAADAPGYLVTWMETKLIEAEAAARTGREGLAPFNEVRNYLSGFYQAPFPPSSATGQDLIYQILEEKYISLLGQLSVFSDLRRTKNLLGVPIKSVNAPDIPQRFLYPQDEIDA